MTRRRVNRTSLTLSVTPKTVDKLKWCAEYLGLDMSAVATQLIIKRYEYLSAKQRRLQRERADALIYSKNGK